MILATQSVASSSEVIFFNISTAKKLAATIDYCNQTGKTNTDLINTLKKTNNKLILLSDEHKLKATELEKDKTIYKTRGDKLEGEFRTCSNSLIKCEEDKPSKLTWFGIGVGSALLMLLVGFFAVK